MFVCLGVRRGLGRVLIKYSGNVRLQKNIYTCYFCPKHNKLYMDEKEIFSSLQ